MDGDHGRSVPLQNGKIVERKAGIPKQGQAAFEVQESPFFNTVPPFGQQLYGVADAFFFYTGQKTQTSQVDAQDGNARFAHMRDGAQDGPVAAQCNDKIKFFQGEIDVPIKFAHWLLKLDFIAHQVQIWAVHVYRNTFLVQGIKQALDMRHIMILQHVGVYYNPHQIFMLK